MSSSAEFEEKKERPDGEPLPSPARSPAEAALGRDLGGVQVHRGAEGARVAGEERARAVTRGQHVYFAPQEYSPDTREGQRLLAHELAHAAQAAPGGGAAAERGALEAEADRAAEAVLDGRRPGVRLRAAPGTALRQESRAPSIQSHAHEVAPSPPSGTVSGGGFSIPYLYTVVPAPSSSALVLQVPEGVAVVVTALTIEAPDYRVQNAEGSRSRAVVISASAQLRVVPRVQVTFTRGSSSYVVVFQLPQTAPAPARAAAPGPAKGHP
jgi:hypothetical protein